MKEDANERTPPFLLKLWRMVEDSCFDDIISWDETGKSFHITDPHLFCKTVLPYYHNRLIHLSSFSRQLNMYGFKKVTRIEKTCLAHAESDQDHMEYMHPLFVRDHPELLKKIKRKVGKTTGSIRPIPCSETTVTVPTKDISALFDELQQLREGQTTMEDQLGELMEENQMLWREMGNARSEYLKQQSVVTKLVHFLVGLVQPNKQQQRIGQKRHLLAIKDEQHTSPPKRANLSAGMFGSSYATASQKNLYNIRSGLDEVGGLDNLSSFQAKLQSINVNEILSLLSDLEASESLIPPPSNIDYTSTDLAKSLRQFGRTFKGPILKELDQIPGPSYSQIPSGSGTQPRPSPQTRPSILRADRRSNSLINANSTQLNRQMMQRPQGSRGYFKGYSQQIPRNPSPSLHIVRQVPTKSPTLVLPQSQRQLNNIQADHGEATIYGEGSMSPLPIEASNRNHENLAGSDPMITASAGYNYEGEELDEQPAEEFAEFFPEEPSSDWINDGNEGHWDDVYALMNE